MSSEGKVFNSPWHDVSSQDFEHYTEAKYTFQTPNSDDIENRNEASAPFALMDVDRKIARTKKGGKTR